MDETNTKLDAILTRMNSVTEEMQSFRKQMEDYGSDLDGIKRKLVESERPVVPPRVEVPQRSGPRGALTNNGGPLLDTPQTSSAGAAGGFHTAPCSPQEHDEVRVRAPRHDFPKFRGATPLLWIDQCLTYFDMFKIPSYQWVGMASLYLEGNAALWYQAYKRRHDLPGWEKFMAAVLEEFGQDEYDGQMSKLMHLRQAGTVADYRQEFEDCMYHLIAVDASLSHRWFVSQFVFGLKDEIRAAVRLRGPTSIARAASLARIQEEESDCHRPRHLAPTKHPPVLPVAATATTPKADWPKKQGTDDFNRERQLRDFRRANNLCF
jgi:hypothetical protein